LQQNCGCIPIRPEAPGGRRWFVLGLVGGRILLALEEQQEEADEGDDRGAANQPEEQGSRRIAELRVD